MTLTRHENGAGATPTFGRRRRGGAQLYFSAGDDRFVAGERVKGSKCGCHPHDFLRMTW